MRAARLLAAGAVVAAAVVLLAPLGRGAAAAPAAAGSNVQLLAQTPWLEGHGSYDFRVGLTGGAATDRLVVTVYDQLHTRTDFDDAAAGRLNQGYFYQTAVPVSALRPDAGGGYDVSLPVNQAAAAGAVFPTVQIGETGVFAVQLGLDGPGGAALGPPLTSFIVYAQQTVSQGQVKPLAASLIIPVSTPLSVTPAGTLASPSPAETTRLSQLADDLNNDSSVHASILATPLSLDEVADPGTLANLRGATQGGPFDLLPTSYSAVPLGDLETAGLAGQIEPQLAAGRSTLESVFGLAPDAHTSVVNGPLDAATLGQLVAHGVTQVIVPNADLTPLSDEIEITPALSTDLSFDGTNLRVIAADAGLTADFTRNEPPVLAANQLLAELAMIYTEAPNSEQPRGVAVMPPPGWSVTPNFVDTVLSGLQGNPLVSAVTAPGLFAATGIPQGTRYLANPDPVPSPAEQSLAASARAITSAQTAIAALANVFGPSSQVRALDQQILLAESEQLTDRERAAVLASIGRATAKVEHAVSLPPATSITLTSTQGQVPITILNLGKLHPKVDLVLTSQRLIFRPFSPPGGTCRVETETTEVCTLTLVGYNTTLKVPVETRSSGVFPLDVALFPPAAPAGSKPLAKNQDTVRSTAVSGVAVGVIVVALSGLVLWWGRDLRRGRRPKGMAPAPVAEPGPGAPVTAGDADVDGFFDRPAPDYGPGMSPTGVVAGPTASTDDYGSGRKARE